MAGYYVLVRKLKLSELKVGDILPEADYTLIRSGWIYQFDWKEKKPKCKLVKFKKD